MESSEYKTGFPFYTDFKIEKGKFGVIFLGDFNSSAAPYEMMAATAEIPEQADLCSHKKVCFWFDFADYQPYGRVDGLAQRILEILVDAGWNEAKPVDGYPDAGSSIDGLVDTSDLGFVGKPEADFPQEPCISGFNAAKYLKIVVEKPEEKPEFTKNEIKEVLDLIVDPIMGMAKGGVL